MSLIDELKDCYISKKNTSANVIPKYADRLSDEDARKLFLAAIRLYQAYCASPAFNKNRQLDMLAENDVDMKKLRILIREYGCGLEKILSLYDEFFLSKEKSDFWEFFDQKLNLPADWHDGSIDQ